MKNEVMNKISINETMHPLGRMGLLFCLIIFIHYSSSGQVFTLPSNTLTVNSEGVITACSYDFWRTDIKIPDEVDGQKIKGIADEVFREKGITNLQLPIHLEEIGDRAFYNNALLYMLSEVGPAVLTFILEDHNLRMTSELILPPNLEKIGEQAFFRCLFPGDITIPPSVSYIGPAAFEDCNFRGTLNIQSTSLTVIEKSTFAGEVAFLSKKNNRRVEANYFIGELKIPNSVTRIESNAFYNNGFAGELILPDNLEYIGSYAFGVNSDFSGEVGFPSTLKYIGEKAFAANYTRQANGSDDFFESQITNFVFDEPSDLERVEAFAFKYCQDDTVVLPTIGRERTRISWHRERNDIIVDTLKVAEIYPLVKSSNNHDFINYDYSYVGTRIPQVDLTIDKFPPEGGSVFVYPSPNERLGTYDIDTEVTLTATPKQGYRFVNWVIEGKDITNSRTELILDSDKTASAYFVKQVSLTLLELPAHQGVVEIATEPNVGLETYDVGTHVTLILTPEDGWGLDKWDIQGSELTYSSENPTIVIMDEDKQVSVSLIEQIYLTLEIEGGGNVTDLQEGSNVINKSSSSFILEGIPNPGYIFDSWEITFSGLPQSIETSTPHTLLFQGVDLTVKAIFSETVLTDPTTLTVKIVGMGIISYPIGRIRLERGSLISLDAEASEGYRFDKWMLGSHLINESSYEFDIDKDTTATAYFIEQTTLTLHKSPANIEAILSPISDITHYYDIGSEVEISVDNSSIPLGYSFDRWTIGAKSYRELVKTLQINTNTTVTAHFLKDYTLTVLVFNNEGGTASPLTPTPLLVKQRDSWDGVMLTTNSEPDYRFNKWVIDNKRITKSSYRLKLQGNTVATAYFTKQVNLSYSTVGSGSISGGKNGKDYDINTTLELKANPSDGYGLDKWVFEGSDRESTSTSLTLTLTSDTVVTAHFVRQANLILATIGSGSIYGGESGKDYNLNTGFSLFAIASDGYRFGKWEFSDESSIEESVDHPLNFNITQDTKVTAYFVPRTEGKVILSLFTFGSGTILGAKNGSEYDINSLVTLSVSSGSGYRFQKWVVSDLTSESESTTLPLRVKLATDVSVTAYFVPEADVKAKLTLFTVGSGNISGGENGKYYEINTPLSLVATANDGYLFDKWVVPAGVETREFSEQLLDFEITQDIIVKAYFVEKKKVRLSLSAVGPGSILGSEDGKQYYLGSKVTISAIAEQDSNFDKWVVGDNDESTVPSLTLTLTSDTTVVAYFFAEGQQEPEIIGIHLYPIPVRYELTIEAKDIELVRLRSLVSPIVYESLHNGISKLEIDVSDLPASTYFLELTQKDGEITVRKVIKK